ncbi:metallophosphoesterase family protein [Metabacillus schmidteae]|uniref:metallophosphoesterase family protein n=1 Tax=Metabacillus schmidteae TaxID=2730405 RepID=UPI00158E86DB|nr:DNA repair exonuclease [Metabacillus schmidteae]
MSAIKFIHAADLHLDSPFLGLKHMPANFFERVRESTFLSFSKIITCAINEKVDFILLSGDLYDEDERSLKAQLKLKKEFERLAEKDIQVFIIHGNHDHMGGKWLDLEWPENVHVFSSHKVEVKEYQKNQAPLAYIYGYSYPERAVHENITSQYIKIENPNVFHIGLLHGSTEGNKEHDVYCPFKVNDLLTKDFDYWALGHIHKRQMLHEAHPVIAYPGNIQGRHPKETGRKGCYLVEMEEGTVKSSFISTEEIRWEQIDVSINECQNLSELIQACERSIDTLKRENKAICLTISFVDSGELANELNSQDLIEDLLDVLNDQQNEQENFVWVVKIIDRTIKPRTTSQKLSTFYHDLENTIKNYDKFDEVIEPLKKNSIFRKHIDGFTKEEQNQLLKKAELLLHRELLQHQEQK